jgi:8-oxo-dGTP pyrophosphatase MutT (NUDIX family)
MEELRLVSFCVLVDQGRALLVHRHAGRRLFPDVWDLPGGHVEPGEAPDETARREVAEEVGVTVVDLELVDVPVDAPGAVTHVYLALSWHGDPANAAPHEHDQIGWFTPAEAELLRLAVPEVAAILRAAVATAT